MILRLVVSVSVIFVAFLLVQRRRFLTWLQATLRHIANQLVWNLAKNSLSELVHLRSSLVILVVVQFDKLADVPSRRLSHPIHQVVVIRI